MKDASLLSGLSLGVGSAPFWPQALPRSRLLRSRLFLLGAVVVLFLAGCSPDQPPSAEEDKSSGRRRVEVATAAQPPHKRTGIFSGTARSGKTHALSFRTSGKIKSIAVQVGQAVQPGDLIAELERTEHRLELQRQKAVADRAEAELDRAFRDYQRVQKLFEVDNVGASRLDAARSAYLSARSRVEEAQQGLLLARERLGYCRLDTKLSGKVAAVPAAEEQTVAAGSPVAVLSRTGEMEIEVFVPESLIYRIQVGDRAEAVFDSLPGRTFTARVKEVGVEPGPTTTYPVRLSLLQADPDLRPGMVGEARFVFDLQQASSLVPPQAVTGDFERQGRVWVFNPETQTVHSRPVELGGLIEPGLIIRSNLGPGERVVLRGAHRLREGQRVQPIAD